MDSNFKRKSGRLIVIALDMGDGRLIRHWADAGHLPHLRNLMADGSWVDLESTAEVLHTSTWPTFATGTLPGRHGVYYPYQPKVGYQQAQHIQPNGYGVPSFWSLADRDGRRCLVFDVPETFPEPGFRGQAIFEWGTWAWYGEQTAQPQGLIAELRSHCGPYPLGIEALRLGLGRPRSALLEERLPKSVAHKLHALQWLIGRGNWDLVVASFCETHPASHYLWPAGVADVAGADQDRFRALRAVYMAIDNAIGAIRAQLPGDSILMVVSGDGVRPNHAGWHLLPTVMERLGYVNAGADAGGRAARPASLLGIVKGLVPARARRMIADNLPVGLRNKLGEHLQTSQIDWSRTRAFTLPTDLEGYIRINLRGREPEGIVEPGAEYEALCSDIQRRLESLVNPATGKPAVRKVWRCHDVFRGPRQEQLPDLVVSWNDEAPIESLAAAGMKTVAEVSPDPRTGTHSTSGFLLACGTGIPAGRESIGHLVQIAPTILRLLGVEGELDLDGQPIDFSAPTSGASSRHALAGG